MLKIPNDEWRPAEPVKYAPIFVLPPRVFELFGWLLSYPGFLWPWNTIYLAVTTLTYVYFTPELSAFAARENLVSLFCQRLILNQVMLTIVAGGWHLVLYVLKLHGNKQKYMKEQWTATGDSRFLFKDQVLDNVFWSLGSGCIVQTCYEIAYMHMAATGVLPAATVYADFWAHPVYSALWLCAIPFWRELHFYVFHRLLHTPLLYKWVHSLHHLNYSPNAWSGMAMHPVEHLLYFSVLLIHWVVPSHPLHFFFNSQHTALTPAAGHTGFHGPLFDGKLPMGSYFHFLHHRYRECNYGESTIPLDLWFGTFNDGQRMNAGAVDAKKEQGSGGNAKKE